LRSGFAPVKSSALAKATREPSCESAAEGARVAASSAKAAVSPDTSARKARNCGAAGAPVGSAVDSKATRRPSPLSDGFKLVAWAGVTARRSGALVCVRPESAARRKASAAERKAAVSLR
jgi:hypothetical protein